MSFTKAIKKQRKLRLNLNGPAGSGKTYSALAIGTGLAERCALIDTEHKSASMYADKFSFDVDELIDNYHPQRLMNKIDEAAQAGFGVLIVDSLSHFWNGKGGMLELVDQVIEDQAARGKKPDSFAAWKKVTPIYNALIQKLLGFPGHLICTARAKMDYDKQKDDRGQTKIVKVGLAPELRDGWQYEFDVEGMLTEDNVLIVGKTRIPAMKSKTFRNPGADVAKILLDDLNSGAATLPSDDNAIQVTAEVTVKSSEVSDKVAKCRAEIDGAKTLSELVEIGARINRAPTAFQLAVEKHYANREAALSLAMKSAA